MMDGIRRLRGWQWIYILEGSLTMAFAFIMFATLPHSPAVAWFLRPHERAWLHARNRDANEAARERDPKAGSWTGVFLFLDTLLQH